MNHRDIKLLYSEVLKHLEGDWLLVGGALLHVLGLTDRVTLDIDLVPLHEVTNADQLKIMDIAVSSGFPPETINFAAEYFVKKQPHWQNELILMDESEKGRIFRPTQRLFTLLKQSRGTETDLMDIELYKAYQEK